MEMEIEASLPVWLQTLFVRPDQMLTSSRHVSCPWHSSAQIDQEIGSL